MQKITTFIAYENQAEEAVNLYTSVFKNSRILNVSRYGEDTPDQPGAVMTINFEIEGQEFIALNGGSHFVLTDGISLSVACESQEEVDELWERLSEGGEQGPCGWLKDRFGLSWQINPTILGRLLQDENPAKAQAVMQAMLKMSKFDIAGLQQAYDQA
jgi:predicted 3-demethylubiquinone-9 3-methyltransferase (glyoxalase superfamily)